MKVQHLKSLTSLRFFAAAMIVIDHATFHVFGHALEFAFYQGVTFFFVLSGFILTYTHPDLKNWQERYAFWIARFARIWPLAVVSLIITLIIVPWLIQDLTSTKGLREYGLYLLLLQSWGPASEWRFVGNSVAWSISAETFFYFCFPFLIHKLDQTRVWKLAFSFACVVMMTLIVGRFHYPTYPSGASDISADGLIYTFPLTRLFEFVLGMVAASFWRNGYFQIHNTKAATWIEAFLIIIITGQLFVGPFWYEWGLPLNKIFNNGAILWLERSGSAPLYAALIIVFSQERGFFSQTLRHPTFVLGGEISFALYLIHEPILRSMTFYHSFLDQIPELMLWPAYTVVTLMASYLLWAFIEKPCRRLIIGHFGRKESISNIPLNAIK